MLWMGEAVAFHYARCGHRHGVFGGGVHDIGGLRLPFTGRDLSTKFERVLKVVGRLPAIVEPALVGEGRAHRCGERLAGAQCGDGYGSKERFGFHESGSVEWCFGGCADEQRLDERAIGPPPQGGELSCS